jgi:serine/threonine protein phosphatase PrpC
MNFRNIIFTIFSCSLFFNTFTAHIPQGNFKDGFATCARSLSQVRSAFVSSWTTSSEVLRTHNKADLAPHIDFQFSTLENTRGGGGRRAYPNQDRSFVGSLAGKICLGVFDGHGAQTGATISEFVRDELPIKMLGYKSAKVGMWNGCSWMQTKIEDDLSIEGKEGGTTAIVGIIEDSQLTVANVGDSRAIGILDGKVTALSQDHKPSHKQERERISRAGGYVYDGYVYGKGGRGLALTRSFGDLLAHQDEVISAVPEIKTFAIATGDILIFASDGLWDVLSNDDVADFVKDNISLGELRQNTATGLSLEARKRGSKDDITVVIAVIKE